MGFKHLFGYALLITGIALALLLLFFLLTNQSLGSSFFLILGICAAACTIVGIILLYKSS